MPSMMIVVMTILVALAIIFCFIAGVRVGVRFELWVVGMIGSVLLAAVLYLYMFDTYRDGWVATGMFYAGWAIVSAHAGALACREGLVSW